MCWFIYHLDMRKYLKVYFLIFLKDLDIWNLLLMEFAAIECVCVCVCVRVRVCLRANNFDVIGLGVKVDQGLPCVRHFIPRSSGKWL